MKKIVIIATFILVGAIAYYFISPLYIKVVVDEASPVVKNLDLKNSSTLEAPSSTDSQLLGSQANITPVVGAPGHRASGTVRLLRTESAEVVRYENFSTINGPDLFVYLATDLEATEFVNLGPLKATDGNFNYAVPPGTDTKKYPYVLVWCKQFGVLFNSAKIN